MCATAATAIAAACQFATALNNKQREPERRYTKKINSKAAVGVFKTILDELYKFANLVKRCQWLWDATAGATAAAASTTISLMWIVR